MNAAKKITLGLLLIWAAVIFAGAGAQAANAPSQTILNPLAPRKLQHPKVVIYTVSWCPHCRELKEYLTSRNIPFINRDVELEPAAMEELAKKYETYGVPVVVIGNEQEVLKGFTSEQFEKAVGRVRSGSRQQ